MTAARLDAKSFFISGTAQSLSQDAAAIISDDPDLADLVRRAILWLLENQYVESDEPHPIVRQVVIGSGMGLAHSSAVDNAAFHTRAELWMTSMSVREHFQIRYYGRYCDDLLVQYDRPDRRVDLVRALSSRLGPVFTIEEVEHDQYSVEMLAFRITAVGSLVHYAPRRIDTAVPLSCRSAHPRRVHDWPLRAICGTSRSWSLNPILL